jgi:hypothetical protein
VLGLGIWFLMAPRVAGTGALLVSLSTSLVFAQQGDVESLFRQGYQKFREGDLPAALSLFEQSFAQNPSSDAVWNFVQEVKVAMVVQMTQSKDRRISGVGLKLLELAREHQREAIEDKEATDTAVRKIVESEGEERIRSMIESVHSIGRNLVPALIPLLGDPELSKRAVVMSVIQEIGTDALPALVAAWKHPDGRVRMNVAALLGGRTLRHEFSVPFLQALIETDPLEEVKDNARQSLSAIVSGANGRAIQPAPAKELFHNVARQFFLSGYDNPFDNPKYSPTVYSLAGDQVVGEKVGSFQLSQHLAKQLLAEALRLDPTYGPAQVLNVMNDSSMVVEYDLNASWYEGQSGYDDIKAILARQKPYVDYVLRQRVLCASPAVMFAALQQAEEDGREEVAEHLLGAIHTKALGGPVHPSVVRALEDRHSRFVRIAAAVALAHWNPQAGFDAGEQVVGILSEAVVQSGIRTVVRVMGNQDLANRLDAIFRGELNMESLRLVNNVEEGLVEVVKLPPDLVVVDDMVQRDVAERRIPPINDFISELRKNYRTSDVPVLVVVDPAVLEKAKIDYESEERKTWVVPANIDALTLRQTVLEPLFREKEDSKALATRLSAMAAEAIEYLASVPTKMPVAAAAGALQQVLSNRPDVVRVPCIRALGHLRAPTVAEELGQVFANKENVPEVRVAAMNSIAKILAAMPESESAPESLLAVIFDGARDADLKLRTSSWVAFSVARASPEEQLRLLESLPPAAEQEGEAADTGGAKEPSGEKANGEGVPPEPEGAGEPGRGVEAPEADK